jgi:uncharacterized SAM-binding protein YcdF (DUF218 family)
MMESNAVLVWAETVPGFEDKADADMRLVVIAVSALVVNVVAAMGVGYALANYSRVDAVGPADAVVVLGGQHDGREEYGIALARQVGAHTVLISNPYASSDPVMRRLCRGRGGGIEIICRAPDPDTTRGEAMMARELATARHWKRIIVVSWRYHLPRTRIVFRQCYSGDPGAVIMRPAPRNYPVWPDDMLHFYVYQYTATAKALLQGNCDH